MVCRMLLFLVAIHSAISAKTEESSGIKPWDLNVVPHSNHIYPNYTSKDRYKNSLNQKKIPMLAWVGYRKAPTPGRNLSEHIERLRVSNPDWKFHLWGNDEEQHFMETYFANTSILWAFKSVNPAVGVSYGDIWRYCVLWTFGGFYVDDDSSIETPLSDIVANNDTMILSAERHIYSECYIPSYKLSKKQLNDLSAVHASGEKGRIHDSLQLFDHPTVNWALFSEPGNLVLENVLKNIVDIFKWEYLKRPVFSIKPHDIRALRVICSTGPVLLAASTKEFCLKNPHSEYLPRMLNTNNYQKYGGVVKFQDKDIKSEDHYVNKMGRRDLDLLERYENRLTLESLETRFIIAKNIIKNIKNIENIKNVKNIEGSNIIDVNRCDKCEEKMNRMNLELEEEARVGNKSSRSWKNSDYLHMSSSTSTGPHGVTSNGTGFNFYRVKNSILIIYPDYTSFLSAYIEGVHGGDGAPENIETVERDELYELFSFNGVNDTQRKRINERNIYHYDVKYNEKNCINNINDETIQTIKKTLSTDIISTNTYPPNIIFSPKLLLCNIVKYRQYLIFLHDFGRFSIPNFDTFLALNFTVENAGFVPHNFVLALPYVSEFKSVNKIK